MGVPVAQISSLPLLQTFKGICDGEGWECERLDPSVGIVGTYLCFSLPREKFDSRVRNVTNT